MGTILYQRSLAEIEAEAVAAGYVQVYIPTEEQKAKGKYAAMCEDMLPDGSDFDWDNSTRHLIPTFDKKPHWISVYCWCRPDKHSNPDYIEHRCSQ